MFRRGNTLSIIGVARITRWQCRTLWYYSIFFFNFVTQNNSGEILIEFLALRKASETCSIFIAYYALLVARNKQTYLQLCTSILTEMYNFCIYR